MRLLVICSALDLKLPYSCTPAWWQLLQALSATGVDLIVTPYAGGAMDSPWWRSYPNPCEFEGNAFARSKKLVGRIAPSGPAGAKSDGESATDKATRLLAHSWVKPRWEKHVARILERERDIDAVLMLTVPPNHLAGLPRAITERFGIPFFFYDGDVPASLPRFSGFQSGFKIYNGADLSEYEAFISNSHDGGAELLQLGAKSVHTLYFGADPDLFSPTGSSKSRDVFFYGHGGEYRQTWISAMLSGPSKRMPDKRFTVRGSGYGVDMGNVESAPYLSFSRLRQYCCESRINLLVTRSTHAEVRGSSTCRPFELAGFGACMVSNPYLGIEEWFEPGKEIVVVNSEDEAVEQYRWLLDNDTAREAIGTAARSRLIRSHTYDHRAKELVAILDGSAVPAHRSSR